MYFPSICIYFQIEIQTTTILLRAIITATMTMPVLPMARTSIPTHFLQSTLQNQIMALRPTAMLIVLRLRGRNEAPPHRFVSTMSPRRPFFASERNGLTRRKVSPWNLPWSMASWVIYPFSLLFVLWVPSCLYSIPVLMKLNPVHEVHSQYRIVEIQSKS